MNAKENHEISDFFKETFTEFKDYLDLQLRYNKLIAAKKTGEISSFLALFVIMAFIAAFFLLITSFGFVWWYSRNDPSQRYVGFLIVMAFYFLAALFIYFFRKKIIFRPLKKFTAQVFFDADELIFKEEVKRKLDDSSDEVEMKEITLDLSDPVTFNLAKEIEQEKIKYKEKRLQAKFEQARVKFDIPAITKLVINSFKEHYLTASMMTKLAFTALKHLKPKKRAKKLEHKKSGK
jgi:Zn-dependent protease with chaperone function